MKKEKDFERAVNQYVNVSLYEPMNNAKIFQGTLTNLTADELTIDYMDKTRKRTIVIPRQKIAKARLAIKF